MTCCQEALQDCLQISDHGSFSWYVTGSLHACLVLLIFCWKQSYLTPKALNKVGFLSLIQRRGNGGVRLKATLRAPAIWGRETGGSTEKKPPNPVSTSDLRPRGKERKLAGGGCNEEEEEGEEEQKGEDDEIAPINKKCIHKDLNNEDMLLAKLLR